MLTDGPLVPEELHKIQRTPPDDETARSGVLRVIDESGEDFLFSADSLLATNPPDQARSSLLRAAVQRHTKIDKIRYRCHCSVLKSVLVMTMQYVTMTEFKQQASRILNDRKPTAILRNSKIEGYYVPAEFLTFDTMDDARVQEFTRSILDQRSDALRYLANR